MKRSSVFKCIKSDEFSFEEKALLLFDYQYHENPLYQEFVNILKGTGFQPNSLSDIPFLPIALFKYRKIQSGQWKPEAVFQSSGTTVGTRSAHLVRNVDFYKHNTVSIWQHHFASLHNLKVMALLPNYLDNPSSSLITMVDHFMSNSGDGQKRFYKENLETFHKDLNDQLSQSSKVLLFGVSFALLEYSRNYVHNNADHLIVVETGGMKKYHREITRHELHQQIRDGFIHAQVLSEYGMTECLSQMYCKDGEYFIPNPMMRIMINDPTDHTRRVGIRSPRAHQHY